MHRQVKGKLKAHADLVPKARMGKSKRQRRRVKCITNLLPPEHVQEVVCRARLGGPLRPDLLHQNLLEELPKVSPPPARLPARHQDVDFPRTGPAAPRQGTKSWRRRRRRSPQRPGFPCPPPNRRLKNRMEGSAGAGEALVIRNRDPRAHLRPCTPYGSSPRRGTPGPFPPGAPSSGAPRSPQSR